VLSVKDDLFLELAPRVHRFTLNAYDFRAPGPNAPLPWLKATLEQFSDVHREKILVGLPFYGYDNQGADSPLALAYRVCCRLNVS
jgi:chitinase domain-containing protein 1